MSAMNMKLCLYSLGIRSGHRSESAGLQSDAVQRETPSAGHTTHRVPGEMHQGNVAHRSTGRLGRSNRQQSAVRAKRGPPAGATGD